MIRHPLAYYGWRILPWVAQSDRLREVQSGKKARGSGSLPTVGSVFRIMPEAHNSFATHVCLILEQMAVLPRACSMELSDLLCS